jgi:hypothetical protein
LTSQAFYDEDHHRLALNVSGEFLDEGVDRLIRVHDGALDKLGYRRDSMLDRPSARDDIAERVEIFVRRTGQIGKGDTEFNRKIDIFESGYLDALGVVHLIGFVEQIYEVTLSEDELLDPRFTNIDGISEILWARLGKSMSI